MLKKLGLIMAAILMLAGCGNDNNIMMPLYTTATMKVSLPNNGTSTIDAAGFTITLPTGLTPALEADGKTVSATVVTPSGTFNGGTVIGTVYTPASGSTLGTLKIDISYSPGVGITQGGEVATVVLKISGLAIPTTSSFAVINGTVTIVPSGATPTVTPTISSLSLH